MPTINIKIEFEDASDFDFLRQRLVGAAEDVVYEARDEGRLDGDVDVSWDTED